MFLLIKVILTNDSFHCVQRQLNKLEDMMKV